MATHCRQQHDGSEPSILPPLLPDPLQSTHWCVFAILMCPGSGTRGIRVVACLNLDPGRLGTSRYTPNTPGHNVAAIEREGALIRKELVHHTPKRILHRVGAASSLVARLGQTAPTTSSQRRRGAGVCFGRFARICNACKRRAGLWATSPFVWTKSASLFSPRSDALLRRSSSNRGTNRHTGSTCLLSPRAPAHLPDLVISCMRLA